MIWRNGRLLSDREAAVSVFDSSMRYGDGIFDMTRSFHGEAFLLDRHIDRFLAGCEWLKIVHGYNAEMLHTAYEELLMENPWVMKEEHRGLLLAGRGPVMMYANHPSVAAHGHATPWVMIVLNPLRLVIGGRSDVYDGVEAEWRTATPFHPEHKHQARLHFRRAEQSVTGGAWTVIVDEHGQVYEATGANIFHVKDGVLHSPGWGALPGISAWYVRRLADIRGVTHTSGSVSVRMLEEADEVFFSCTPYSIVPCKRFGKVSYPGARGLMYQQLRREWEDAVDLDFRKQVVEMGS